MMDQLFCSDEMETVILDHPLHHHDSPSPPNPKPSFTRTTFRSPSGRPDLLIEPPSYADVVFNPYTTSTDIKQQPPNLDNGLHNHQSNKTQGNHLKITVSDPKPQDSTTTPTSTSSSVLGAAGGGGVYVTYLITTYTDMPEFEGTSFSVRRRFREVVALADRLGEVYRGYFIPARPDKNVQLMQRQDFVEQRAEALDKYFFRLAEHPVLRRSLELRQFLKSPSSSLSSLTVKDLASSEFDDLQVPPSPAGPVEPVKGGSRDFLRAFKELKQYVVNDWGGAKPLAAEEDKKFLEQKERILSFGRELVQCSEHAESFVKAQEDIGTVMGTLGLALNRLGQLEGDHAALVTGNAAVKASRCYREANLQCMKHLETFHEYLALMQAVHSALGERSKALVHVQMLKADIAALEARHEKLTAASMRIFGGDQRKVDEVRAAITSAEAACVSAQAEYERIMGRNAEEIQIYEVKRETDLFGMLKGVVQTQVAYAEKLAKAWSEVAESSSSGESSMSASV